MLKMSRCLRIFGAYSFRLTRRHSTILLTASFIAVLVTILQLYAHRFHDTSDPDLEVNYVYKPGLFLKNKQPGNNSYCYFKYGLPNKLNYDTFKIYPTPQMGNWSAFRVIYNAIEGLAYRNYNANQAVTYATHATPEFLYHIVEIARYWEGPISLAVYVPSYDLDLTMQIMTQLCHCYSGMLKVSMHLFYPIQFPPQIRSLLEKKMSLIKSKPIVRNDNETAESILNKKITAYRQLNKDNRGKYIQWVRKKRIERMMHGMPKDPTVVNLEFKDCSGLDSSYKFKTVRKAKNMKYPVNVARNVARNASKTTYFLVSDIEMIPSYGLAQKFLRMIRKLLKDGEVYYKMVFVVPLFEVEKGVIIPHEKATLIKLVNRNLARYFHMKECAHCQRFPGLQTWLSRPPRDELEPMIISRREYPYHRWEPLYFSTGEEPWYSEMLTWEGRQDKMTQPMIISRREYPYHRWEPLYFSTGEEPWYSEMLTWEGRQDKMTQMLEMCLQEYQMVVLDGGFLCQAAVPKTNRSIKAMMMNAQSYVKIVDWLRRTYNPRPQCRVYYGFI